MLRLDQVDLPGLVLARNDTYPDGNWWFDPETGRTLYYGLDDDSDLPELVHGRHVVVSRTPSGREDIEDFLDLASVGSVAVDADEVARLTAASRAKGGLRRFRDQVARSSASDAWSSFLVARESVRAIDWLVERGLVDAGSTASARRDLCAAAHLDDDGRGRTG